MRYFVGLLYSIFLLNIFFAPTNSYAQLLVTPGQTAAVLAAKLAGPGVTITSPILTCPAVANGTFVSTGTPLTIDSGIILTSGKAIQASGPESFLASTNNGAAGDPALAALAGTVTHDACVLEFDFVPVGDTVKFNYQFGSEEYNHSTCGQYNDPFAFFISGPGITGIQNMALVPGTTIPVAVNSINSGVPGPTSLCPTCDIANCNSMGAGSPFTAYYYDNTGGTDLTYKGFTIALTAVHDVIPCNQYHLKLAICDVSNSVYDSGVFLEAGSLQTNSYSFSHIDSVGATINGTPNTVVKGCAPTTIKIRAMHANPTPQTITLLFGGTAINGVDLATVPGSVIIPADSLSTSINIQGLPTPPLGPKRFTLYLQAGCGIADSISVNILDTPTAAILTPDTTICSGATFPIRVSGTAGLTYNWSPATSLSSSTVMMPFASPTAFTTYTMTAMLPASGCPPITRNISVTVDSFAFSIITPDTIICNGDTVHIRVNGSDLTYSWGPATGLNSTTIKNPNATPVVTTTYSVVATDTFGCAATDTLHINVAQITATISNPDTAICRGASVQVAVAGDPTLSYQWIPTAGIAHSTILNPVITPDTSATYYLKGTVPGCSKILDSIKIDVQPNPDVYIGGNRGVCNFDTLQIKAYVTPGWYTHYSYSWSPGNYIDDTTASAIVFTGITNTHLVLHVTTPAGCKTADSANITVYPQTLDTLHDTTVCPNDSIQLKPRGTSVSYAWHPGIYLSDSTVAQPWLHAITSQDYSLIGTSSFGCKDTVLFKVTVHPAAIIYLGDSTTIYPGESYHILSQSNCTSFEWFPPSGLDDPHISSPTASPEVSTKYVVYATNESGCIITDSINIFISPESLLDLPNAFTPGNGPNALFKIIKRGKASLKYFRIFNRWGNMVYSSTNIEEGWDGTYNGTLQPFGVFVYEIEAVTNTGKIFHKQGNVTLIK